MQNFAVHFFDRLEYFLQEFLSKFLELRMQWATIKLCCTKHIHEGWIMF